MQKRLIVFIMLGMLVSACSRVDRTVPPEATVGIFNPPPIYTATLPGVPSPVMTPTKVINFPESINTEELHRRLDPFVGSDDCTLPCYNGLVMGQSDTHDVYNFYAALGVGIPDLIPGDFPVVQETGTGRLGAWLTKTTDALNAEAMGLAAPQASIFVQNDVAETLFITWDYYPSYLSLPYILNTLGGPQELDLALIFDEDPTSYLLTLNYPSQQIGFAFYGQTTGDTSARQVCLNADQVLVTTMGLAKPDLTPLGETRYSEHLLPLTTTLNITYNDFAAAMTSDGCITIPAAVWPAWQVSN